VNFLGELSGARQTPPLYGIDYVNDDPDDLYHASGRDEEQPLQGGGGGGGSSSSSSSSSLGQEARLFLATQVKMREVQAERDAYLAALRAEKEREDGGSSHSHSHGHDHSHSHGHGHQKACCNHAAVPRPTGTAVAAASDLIER
jgi:hypothetical protein